MLKKYKNRLLKIIRDTGLDLSQFKTSEDITGPEHKFIIVYDDTGLRCYVAVNPRSHHNFRFNYTRFNPDFPWANVEKPQRLIYHIDIDEVYHRFREWLKEVQQYVEESLEPDLWEQIQGQKKLVTATRIVDQDKLLFSEEQKAELRMAVGELRQLIASTFQPDSKQIELINERLDYLVESVDRLNRFDWKALALSMLVSISIALSLDTDKGQLLFTLFKKVFSGIAHLLQ
ncbi:MAG TPA: hypothetical protein VMY06_03855 [Sedimentisphaerales bacterium]|nr:hypothetical protein [Sedimentisphaerales bacterium]